MQDSLRLQPGQQRLTAEQEAEARRFAAELLKMQSSTDPVNEQEAEEFLRQAYRAAGLAAPEHIYWLDGPLPLVWVLLPDLWWSQISDEVSDQISASMRAHVKASIRAKVGAERWARVEASPNSDLEDIVWATAEVELGENPFSGLGKSVEASIANHLGRRFTSDVRKDVNDCFGSGLHSLWANVGRLLENSIRGSAWERFFSLPKDTYRSAAHSGVRAYLDASWLHRYHFFSVYLEPNALHALACFNELVSGYWSGKECALIVRRPRVLARDPEGRLHSATGKCVEYLDGWGGYAWHGVGVPEKVIMAPGSLTPKDVMEANRAGVRQIIQDRMKQRFVPELDARLLDEGERGRLYEVLLPEEPEGVAHYLELGYMSPGYFVQVPLALRTAAEASEWDRHWPRKEI